MRYTPAAAALALLAAVTSSVTHSASPTALDPRAAQLVAEGEAALSANRIDAAIDAFEAALVIEPGASAVLIGLGRAARANGMQGKALHYYRRALVSDPRSLAALAGEGEALAEKGAVQKAERSLARLKGMCGAQCPETRIVAEALARIPAQRVVRAEAVVPEPVVSDN